MRFKSIDSLRGLAASAVVFYHLWNRFFPGATSQTPAFHVPAGLQGHVLFFLFGFGYFGVNLFFVVSGLCIHLPQALKFHATGADRLDGRRFAKRRFFRLYPAYFASLVWTSLVLIALPLAAALLRHTAPHLLAAADLPSFAWNALFLQPFHLKAFDFNGVYWTLLYEVQFYLFYPLLLWLCRRWSFRGVLFVLLACEVFFIVRPVPIHDLFLGRFYEWFLGMYLAEFIATRRPLRVPLWTLPVLTALAIASVFNPATWAFRDVFGSTAFAAILAVCLEREASLPWLTHSRVVGVGVFSYSLYLVHVPMIDLFWNSTRLARTYVPAIPQAVAFLSVPAAFLLGMLFYRFFEKPFLGERRKEPVLVSGTAERAW